jgi:hypothetical protein
MAEAKAPAKTTKAKATPKAPQDRKPKAEEEAPFIPEETPGWHLLRPFAEVPVWDQAPIMALVEEISEAASKKGKPGEEVELSNTSDMLGVVGSLAKALLSVAIDPVEYTKFVSGREGLQNATNLGFAWVRQMGESEASES